MPKRHILGGVFQYTSQVRGDHLFLSTLMCMQVCDMCPCVCTGPVSKEQSPRGTHHLQGSIWQQGGRNTLSSLPHRGEVGLLSTEQDRESGNRLGGGG